MFDGSGFSRDTLLAVSGEAASFHGFLNRLSR